MRTTIIINNLDKKELLKWKAEIGSILDESRWKLTKTERVLHLHQSALQGCREKLESERKRAEETRLVLQFLSEGHPLRHRCEDDIYKTEIRIFRLENKLKKFSILKPIQLEIKKITIETEIKYYEEIIDEINNLLNPPVVLRRILNSPDGEAARNLQPYDENIFILQPKKEAMVLEKRFQWLETLESVASFGLYQKDLNGDKSGRSYGA